MLSEAFLNSCFLVIFNEKSKVRKDKTLYRDILEILDFCQKRETIDIPLTVKNKVDCLSKVCKFKLDGKSDENVIDSVTFGEKYKSLKDFLETSKSRHVTDEIIADNVKQVRIRRKMNYLLANYDQISSFLDMVKDGNFDSVDDIVGDYETVVKQLYSNLMESNRAIAIEASSSVDLAKDDLKYVLNLIQSKYASRNTIPTGYRIFDNDVFNGGFEASRLYIVAGGTGAGKSTLLNNFIANSATIPRTLKIDGAEPKSDLTKVYIYITLENTIEEAFLRTYMPLFGKTIPQVLTEIQGGVNIKDRILKELKKTNSTIVMRYFPGHSISPVDVMMVIDDVISEYSQESIQAVYVDYLDLLRSDRQRYDLYRIELSDIALSLKNIAVEYNIPVITATQLGRSAYRIYSPSELGLEQVAESIKKAEHADCVILLSRDPIDEEVVHMKIGKNRSGKANVSLDFKVNFGLYKFIAGTRVSSSTKTDTTKDNLAGFGGLSGVNF